MTDSRNCSNDEGLCWRGWIEEHGLKGGGGVDGDHNNEPNAKIAEKKTNSSQVKRFSEFIVPLQKP